MFKSLEFLRIEEGGGDNFVVDSPGQMPKALLSAINDSSTVLPLPQVMQNGWVFGRGRRIPAV